MKNSDIFHISARNIDCGYSLEPPHRGGSNEFPQSMYLSRNKKNNVYPCKPHFYYIKVGFKGVKIYRRVFVMSDDSILSLLQMGYAAPYLSMVRLTKIVIVLFVYSEFQFYVEPSSVFNRCVEKLVYTFSVFIYGLLNKRYVDPLIICSWNCIRIKSVVGALVKPSLSPTIVLGRYF